jgi:glutamate-ammonia-ligase adenylyltransferase
MPDTSVPPALAEIITTTPPVYNRPQAAEFVADLEKKSPRTCEHFANNAKLRELVTAIMGASAYLRTIMLRYPQVLEACLAAPPNENRKYFATRLKEAMREAKRQDTAMAVMRDYKRHMALLIALADIGGVWDLKTITAAITETADTALQEAVTYLLNKAAEKGDYIPKNPENPALDSGYIILAMGKQGGFELNYSSDVDLVVFFTPELCRLKEGLEHSQFFVRLTRDLVKLMQQRTSDGYVFRTDLRLRPDPGATQIALSVDAAISYYEAFGRNWERAAMIKARPVAGDIAAGEDFLLQVSPFIWRKYLDFAAIVDVHSMKKRVHEFKGHGEIAVAGHNLKLGRGGIREIEFFVQTHQLIAGGRQPELRGRATIPMLAKLAKAGWINRQAAEELTSAYEFLRKLEHRLQMLNDEQTQTLPQNTEELERIAMFSGFNNASDFASGLIHNLSLVQEHYSKLFEQLPETGGNALAFAGEETPDETLATLSRMGFSQPQTIANSIGEWYAGHYPATRSERAREQLSDLSYPLLYSLAATANPDGAFAAFDRFLQKLPSGVQLFALLWANQDLLKLLADIMGDAPRLAQTLARQPKLLDAMLDPGFFGVLPEPGELDTAFAVSVEKNSNDYQGLLDAARIVGKEQAFLIGVRILSGTISAEQAGHAYASLASSTISHLQKLVEGEMLIKHGSMQEGAAVVLAMGKLGGKEMSSSSDLDLIVIYDHSEDAKASDGEKPLSSGQYYARFTQRLISALSAPMAEGRLYEVDMRLRPSGKAGPVATSLESFVNYQKNDAWVWEHMALTRARIVSGSPELARKVNEAMAATLCIRRHPADIADEVIKMRQRIWDEKGTDNIWNIKHARGGIVDLEFIAQYMQIVHANAHPKVLDTNTGTALARLARVDALPCEDAEILINAHGFYMSLIQILRLCYDDEFVPQQAPEGLKQLMARYCGEPDFNHLELTLRENLQKVAGLFAQLVAENKP